ncbi:MAG: hypothetical protein KatS3mg131_1749 [Candidatus Tectimicrobiota bacterium]|nr:MAG: hypothetical protein KatS3mg131_1749 [Candidatus Tectomicrobia bacterium]
MKATASVAAEVPALVLPAGRRTPRTMTLYDLIAALQAVASSGQAGEESLVVAAVVHLLRSGHVVFLSAGASLAEGQATAG